jgi:hypothetical protein
MERYAAELLYGRPRQEIAVEDNSIRVIIAPPPMIGGLPKPPVLIGDLSDAGQGPVDR